MSPTVAEFMTPLLHAVPPTASLADAKAVMEEHGIRHVPVLEEGRAIGMVTLSDVFVIEEMLSVDAEAYPVTDAMGKDLYTIDAETELAAVAAHMSKHHLGSAIVARGGRPIGIFTASDALRALAHILQQR
jgi:acetoin utilization protein AcuB